MHRTIRSLINFGSIIGFQVLTLSIGIFSTPLLLLWLGDDRYGAFRATSDLTNYLHLLELGLSGSLISLLASAVGSGDYHQIYLTLATGIKAYLKITGLIVLSGVGLGIFITHLVPVTDGLVHDLQIGYWIGTITILTLPLTPFQLLMDASQRSYLANIFLGLQSVVITSLSLLFAWMKWGISGQYLAVVVGAIVFQIVMCWNIIHRYPKIFSAWRDRQSQVQIEKQLWQLNRSTFILKLSGQLSLFTDNIIISYVLNPATVVPFFITQRLSSLVQSQLQGIGNASWAALADLYTKGERQKFNDRVIELTRLVSLMGCICMTPIVAYNHYFIGLWVGSERFGGDLLTILAACNGIFQGLLSLWGWCFSGTGQQAKLVRPNIIATTVNLILSVTCTYFLGLIGPLLGTFIAFTTVSIWQLPLVMQTAFGMSLRQLFLAATKPLIVGVPYATLVWWIANNHTPWGWFGLATEMGITVVLFAGLAWLLILSELERIGWRERFGNLVNR
jgi:O-antigen/teichoic acid export membrane protein